jgi:hypothetical protein
MTPGLPTDVRPNRILAPSTRATDESIDDTIWFLLEMVSLLAGTIAFHLTSKWRHVKLCSGPGLRALNL